VPCIHLSTFKKELDHLVALDMLIPQKESEYSASRITTRGLGPRLHVLSARCC
jgi:hypothetical protein